MPGNRLSPDLAARIRGRALKPQTGTPEGYFRDSQGVLHKRTDPSQDAANTAKIISDIEKREGTDIEDPVAAMKRRQKFSAPPDSGGLVTGYKKNNPVV